MKRHQVVANGRKLLRLYGMATFVPGERSELAPEGRQRPRKFNTGI